MRWSCTRWLRRCTGISAWCVHTRGLLRCRRKVERRECSQAAGGLDVNITDTQLLDHRVVTELVGCAVCAIADWHVPPRSPRVDDVQE